MHILSPRSLFLQLTIKRVVREERSLKLMVKMDALAIYRY